MSSLHGPLLSMDMLRGLGACGCGAAWGTPSRFFEMYSPKLPVATHPTAPKGMPDVAFIHNFGVRTMLCQQQLSSLT